jgi:hypothetical protein
MQGELRAKLLRQRSEMIRYLKLKTWMQDWHGVADAANDLREIDAKLEVIPEPVNVDTEPEVVINADVDPL